MTDPLTYYHLEDYLFGEVNRRFHTDHSISAFDLFSIIIWKTNRAKSKIAYGFLKHCRDRDIERGARDLSAALWGTPSAQGRLGLMGVWGFRLPTASAILTVLWPDEFTVYDTRVCDELRNFHQLKDHSLTRVWKDYCLYREAVQSAAPEHLSLRDKDRFLWGRSNAQQLEHDLQSWSAAPLPPN